MKAKYIDVKGMVRNYYYTNHQLKRKPKCPNCSFKLHYIVINIDGNRVRIGYYCKSCNQTYIYDKYNVFLLKSESNNEVST